MHHDLVWILWGVGSVAFAPVVTDSVGKDITVVIESCSWNGTSHGWVTLESMLSYSVPEVKCAIRSSSTESAMYWMERDGIDGIHICHVV